MTDGEFSQKWFWTDQATVGWRFKTRIVLTIDLGAVQPVNTISFNTCGNRDTGARAGVDLPDAWFLVSADGEMRFSLGLVMMSGGSLVLGDWLPQLDAEGRRHLGILLGLGGGTPSVPLDLDGSRPSPCLFRNDRALFAFNPFATPITLSALPGLHLGPDAFTGAGPDPSLILSPHACRVHPLA